MMRARVLAVALFGAILPMEHASALGDNDYPNAATCAAKSRLGANYCRNAYASAQAELLEKAPRFTSRESCEAYFPRCSVASVNTSGKQTIVPVMKVFRILGTGPSAKVVPIVDRGLLPLPFLPRSIQPADTSQDARVISEAQVQWKLLLSHGLGKGDTADPTRIGGNDRFDDISTATGSIPADTSSAAAEPAAPIAATSAKTAPLPRSR
jgi:hypothetical protein